MNDLEPPTGCQHAKTPIVSTTKPSTVGQSCIKKIRTSSQPTLNPKKEVTLYGDRRKAKTENCWWWPLTTPSSATSTPKERNFSDISMVSLIYMVNHHSLAFSVASAASAASLSAFSLAYLYCSAILSLYSLSNSSLSSAVTSLLLTFWYCLNLIHNYFLVLSPISSLTGLANKLITLTAKVTFLSTSNFEIWFYRMLRYYRAGNLAKSPKSDILFFRKCKRASFRNSPIPTKELMELSAKYKFFRLGEDDISFNDTILFPLNSKVSRMGCPLNSSKEVI